MITRIKTFTNPESIRRVLTLILESDITPLPWLEVQLKENYRQELFKRYSIIDGGYEFENINNLWLIRVQDIRRIVIVIDDNVHVSD